ncbi:tRNA (adenosine(37)-N6)-methyltransferase TrmM [Parabacteroides sp. An277]|uniref:tRNA1(Val) (adenine(37)-N6)-methyltransferase n=1 Tax=Parabacteroides sp. An277 TaxID=1965619 RepID=UPI000B39A08B|nr:methyltransferase [Parabacteroides sp. An277]OUO51057.1 tRNA (adenosine(37)-N6)-methyltransferase TrmM [Parabacteroides sp. An277]
MSNPYFKFKQFTVWHDKCAMKVGTDGVLLGAWCACQGTKRILDIGCGTGLIALMLAQRTDALIDALDIDADACLQARENVARSPFAEKIRVVQADLARFADEQAGIQAYDCIVSNPPFFVDSLKCPDRKRTLARHTDSLPLHRLLADSHRLLADEGSLHLILPFSQRERLQEVAFHEGLFMNRETHVYPTPTSQPKRLLVSLSRQRQGTLPTRLTIEQEPRCYTEEFATLVAPFYL